MNQEQNNLNQNNFNTQGNNGIPNNQPLNNQNFNQGMSFNQQAVNPQPQPMNNTIESRNDNNQGFNNKPPKKMNLGLIIGIVVAVAVVVVGIVFGSKLLSNSTNSNNNSEQNNEINSNNQNTTATNWGLTINGKSINLPCTLKDLKDADITISSDYDYEQVMNTVNTKFSNIAAGNDNWTRYIYLTIVTGDDTSKKESNAIVNVITNKITTNIYGQSDTSKIITKEQFHLKGDIAIGSTSNDVTSIFGNEYTVYADQDGDKNLSGNMTGIYYTNKQSTLYLIFKKGILHSIEIVKK